MSTNIVSEIQIDPNDDTKTVWGALIADEFYFAWVNGGSTGENFDANTDISQSTKTLMDEYSRGVWVDLGGGNNEAVGTGYSDSFTMGSGTGFFDGGANAGIMPWGGSGQDTLDVYLTDSSQTVSVDRVVLSDGDQAQAYTYKVSVVGGDGGVAFIRDIEGINVQIWTDTDSDNIRDWDQNELTYKQFIPLSLSINEIRLNPSDSTRTDSGDLVADMGHFAWVNGGSGDESFNAALDISQATRSLMDINQRGVWVDLAGGVNRAVGSDYADNFTMGTGTNYIDGGDNAGMTPWGSSGQDLLDVYLTSSNQFVAVTAVSQLDGIEAQNYSYKVAIAGAPGVAYVKNIEGVNVQLWNDANGDGQRDWSSELTYTKFIPLGLSVNELRLDANDSSLTEWGSPVADQFHFAWANGGQGDETFVASSAISTNTQALMDQYDRGVWVDLGDGTNRATGSAYSDNFTMGAGIDYVDGGANLGTMPWGSSGQDMLDVYVTAPDQTVNVSLVTAQDGAEAQGYTYKVTVSGKAGVAYLKDIEGINVQLWDDVNNDDTRDWNGELTYQKFIALGLNVNELRLDPNDSSKTEWGDPVANQYHFAWVNGGLGDETFDASLDISSATLTLMADNERGVWVDLGDGTNVVTGSDFADNFTLGFGTDYIDGGAEQGTMPWGGNAQDMLDIYVTSANQTVSVTQVTDLDGQDAQGYDYKVTVAGTARIAYLKDIEGINVQLWNDIDGDGERDWDTELSYEQFIPLALHVNEIRLDPNDSSKTEWGQSLAQQGHFAWVRGGSGNETFSADLDISPATLTLMSSNQRGVSVDLGDGENTAVGSAYADNFVMGAGTDYIDGGANLGQMSWGGNAQDLVDVYLTSLSQIVNVTAVTQSDGTAAQDYQYKVTVSGRSGTAFVKNIEGLNVQLWDDKNSNGEIDWDNNELTYQQFIPLALTINEIRVDSQNPSNSEWGMPLAEQFHFAWVNGGFGNETFNAATDISQTTQALMVQYERGLSVDLGDGVNTAVGSAYADNFTMGSGTDFIDGGDNLGTSPWGGETQDLLDVYITSTDQSVNVTQVTSEDGDAARGYLYKVSIEGGSGVAYVKNIEGINVQLWDDKDGDGTRDWSSDDSNELTYQQFIPLALNIFEDPTNQFHVAYVNGGLADDLFNPSILSESISTVMSERQIGASIKLGEGNDTAIGTDYADTFEMGSGINFVDGGLDLGNSSWGGRDVIEVFITSQDERSGISVTDLDGSGSAQDIDAYSQGYTQKLISTTTSETTYFKNVEMVLIQLWTDANGNDVIDWNDNEVDWIEQILTKPYVIPNATPTLSSPFIGFVFGTASDETFVGNTIASQDFSIQPENLEFGAYVYSGRGLNTMVGTVFNDTFGVEQIGSSLIDGGSDEGYFRFDSTVRLHSDMYRFFIEQPAPKTVESDTAGGYTAEDLNLAGYRLIDVREWTDTLTSIDATTTSLSNKLPGGGDLNAADLAAIGQQAQVLSIDQANSIAGIDWIVVKRDLDGGDVSGVDFLKDIEAMQFVLWYDRVHDGRPSGGARETFNAATFELEVDSFVLTTSDFESQILGSRAGAVIGSSFDDVIDVSQEDALAGFRLFDDWGNDQVTGTVLDDFFILGRGNDDLDGSDGTDRVAVSWQPSVDSAQLSQALSVIEGIPTVVISENSDQGSVDILTLALTAPDEWTVSALEADNSGSSIQPLNDNSGNIGINTLSNIEYFSIYQNAVTSEPAVIDLELNGLFVA